MRSRPHGQEPFILEVAMRILMMLIVTLGMISPTFAGVLSERDRGNQWFQNCEEEIARPFCGALKINLEVDALTWQWQKPSTLGHVAQSYRQTDRRRPHPWLLMIIRRRCRRPTRRNDESCGILQLGPLSGRRTR